MNLFYGTPVPLEVDEKMLISNSKKVKNLVINVEFVVLQLGDIIWRLWNRLESKWIGADTRS